MGKTDMGKAGEEQGRGAKKSRVPFDTSRARLLAEPAPPRLALKGIMEGSGLQRTQLCGLHRTSHLNAPKRVQRYPYFLEEKLIPATNLKGG